MKYSDERVAAAIALADAAVELRKNRAILFPDVVRTLQQRYLDATVRDLCAPDEPTLVASGTRYQIRVTNKDYGGNIWTWYIESVDAVCHPVAGEIQGFAGTRAEALQTARTVADVILGARPELVK